jgi:hypothetical protein
MAVARTSMAAACAVDWDWSVVMGTAEVAGTPEEGGGPEKLGDGEAEDAAAPDEDDMVAGESDTRLLEPYLRK